MSVIRGSAWVLESPKRPLVLLERHFGDPGPGEVLVEVSACGLCHTDLGFFDGSVAPKHSLPLVLGHEIVGRVIAAGEGAEALAGRRVLVPAVMPCGECAFCRAGRANACPQQLMPGNDADGGFATHVKLPARSLVPVPEALQGEDFESLAVVADAVSTAAQAVLRSGLQAGDVAFVVGAGGVGAFAVQVAKAKGASVVAFDVRGDRLALVKEHGVDVAIDVTGTSLRDVRGRAHQTARDARVPSYRWRIFECSGTRDGQLLAYGLLAQAATMVVVGYTRNPVELRLSNLMAFDATVHGSWGCPPEVYPEVLDLISGGEIALAPFIARAPMSRLPALLEDMAGNRLDRRMVLDPRV